MATVARFQFRKDTTQNWQLANPILLDGEMGIEETANGSLMFKIGDGIANAAGVVSGTHWNDLPYSSGPEGKPPLHEWSGTNLRFQNPDGSWGLSVNLKGERGVKGDKGDQGIQGPVGPPYILPPATITQLGGIKVGKNLSITIDGCLSAPDPFYVPIRGIIGYGGAIGGSDGRRPVWNGEVNEDWVLCDGIWTNGVPVPDLRDKFIVGAGHLYGINTTGGDLSHVHEIFKTDTGNVPGNSYVENWDTRRTGQVMMRGKDMPQHTHVINADWGSLPVGVGPVSGNALAYAIHDSAVSTNWNNLTGYKRFMTAQTPKNRPYTAWGNDDNSYSEVVQTAYTWTHTHTLHKQNTEPTTSLPPYHALIYLIRVQ